MASPPDVYAARSRYVIDDFHKKYEKVLKGMDGHVKAHLPSVPKVTTNTPVCIIGAGAAGLYTALILDSLEIPYQILEANPTLVGGRMFTYNFDNDPSSYNYYDVGAMRFPDSPFMKRTFDLVNRQPPILTSPPEMIPYIFEAPNTYLYFNGVQTANVSTLPPNPFDISPSYVPASVLAAGQPAAIIDAALDEPRQLFVTNKIQDAMTQLYETYDQYSMRSWLESRGLSSSAINYCETLDKSTGWYDRALTETVLESLAFNWPGPGPAIQWKCFDHGTYQLPLAMHDTLSTKAVLGCSVKAISETDAGLNVTMTFLNPPPTPQPGPVFAAVISTVTLSCLSVMDLTGCNIPGGNNDNYSQWAAMRQLQYGPSIKIGIKFTTPWWASLPGGSIMGGQSYTDLPIRTIVYPSYPADAPADQKSPVLIVSYCWTQDAERLSALINRDGSVDPDLIDLVLRDLAQVHKVPVSYIQPYYDGNPSSCFAWSWGQNKLTMGAYGFFGPQQFANSSSDPTVTDSLYANITLPAAGGKLFFAGEATSSCHAWVAGAFDSAWRAVQSFLIAFSSQYDQTYMDKFTAIWGDSEYWDETTLERHMKIAIHLSKERRKK